jgi:hypothetical protein
MLLVGGGIGLVALAAIVGLIFLIGRLLGPAKPSSKPRISTAVPAFDGSASLDFPSARRVEVS